MPGLQVANMAEKLDERFHALGFDLVKVRQRACHMQHLLSMMQLQAHHCVYKYPLGHVHALPRCTMLMSAQTSLRLPTITKPLSCVCPNALPSPSAPVCSAASQRLLQHSEDCTLTTLHAYACLCPA